MKIGFGKNELEVYEAFHELLPSGITKLNVGLHGCEYPDISFMKSDDTLIISLDNWEERQRIAKNTSSAEVLFYPENAEEKVELSGQMFTRNLQHEVEILIVPNKVLYPKIENL